MSIDKSIAAPALQINRRGFLTGVSVALTGLPVSTLATEKAAMHKASRQPYGRAVYQQMAYFDFDGVGEQYQAPDSNVTTRDYVNGLSEEEFLRKHWFT